MGCIRLALITIAQTTNRKRFGIRAKNNRVALAAIDELLDTHGDIRHGDTP